MYLVRYAWASWKDAQSFKPIQLLIHCYPGDKNVLATQCPAGHNPQALCKMQIFMGRTKIPTDGMKRSNKSAGNGKKSSSKNTIPLLVLLRNDCEIKQKWKRGFSQVRF